MNDDHAAGANETLDRVFTPQHEIHRWSETAWLGLADLLGAPTESTLSIQTTSGDEDYRVQILHTVAVTITEDGDDLNGTYGDTEEDFPVLVECAARFIAADGTVGYGHLERGIRRSRIADTESAVDSSNTRP